MLRISTTLACLLVLVPAAARAQSVRGRVVDAETGKAIADVRLILINASNVRVAESLSKAPDGLFVMAAREPGRHTIQAELIGYRTATTTSVEIRSREQVIVDVKLTQRALQLEPLVVTGRRRDARLESTVEGLYARHAMTPPIGTRRVFLHSDLEMRTAMRPMDVLQGIPISSCMTVYWNGTVINYAPNADLFLDLPVTELEGVEFYRSQLDAPIIFRDPGAPIAPPVNTGVAESVSGASGGRRQRDSLLCSVLALWSRQPHTRWGVATIPY